MADIYRLCERQLEEWGQLVIRPVVYTVRVLAMIYLAFRAALFDQSRGLRTVISVLSAQIYFTGFQALPLITVLALSSGSIVIMQSASQFSFFGGEGIIGDLMVMVIVREIAPLLTALIVIARSGTAVASEIGNMRVNREILALEAMGIHPYSYIVFPRLMGGVVSVLCLAFYYIFISLLGGYLVTRLLHDMPFGFYAEKLAAAFAFEDVALFLLKNTFSGLIIFTVSCHQGLMVKQSPHEVPQVATRAVVNSIIYVVFFNLLVTTLFYLNQLLRIGVL